MAIASGIAVPQAYVLDNEKCINAFAAGLRLDDAVIAVTRGAIERFNREEMQGVIAHEFSHILYGDSRLNIQLIGLIYGIMAIGIIGNELMEQKFGNRLSPLAFFTGVLLRIIGSGGSFAGKLIQCAISRQKELLADASAVRFTRNPQGLASALKKIGGYLHGSKIKSVKAEQASHLFFSESRAPGFFREILATHPPLSLRIALLDPSFDGKFTAVAEESPAFSLAHREAQLSYAVSPLRREYLAVNADKVTGRVGNPAEHNGSCGGVILASIPPEIRWLLNSPAGAVRIIVALLLGENCNERAAQIKIIRDYLDRSADYEEVMRLCNLLSEMPGEQRLPLAELAMPQLRTLAGMERRNFLAIISSLAGADGRITLFEFCVQWILQDGLIREKEDIFSKIRFFSIAQVGYDILIILRALACAGNSGNEAAARTAFRQGISRIPELAAKNPDFLYVEKINYAPVGTAFRQLGLSSYKIKQAVIDACAHCAFVDARVTVAETELLRVISLALHCPLPPFSPTAPDEAAVH